jgi:putative ABC transport system permease protein
VVYAILGVGLTVAITASLGAFFAASRARMTELASKGIPVDWQVLLTPGTNVTHAEHVVTTSGGVETTGVVGYARASGFKARTGATVQTTGPGKVLGLPSGYASAFPGEIRDLVGATSGVLVAQQTAANLHAVPGTSILVERPGLPPARVRVAGVVDLPQADSLFQAVGSGASSLIAPPDNVVLLPLSRWHRLFDPVANVHPDAVRAQIHVKLAAALPADPGAAFADVTARAKNLEARLAGAGVVGNNLAASLDAARTDAIYAELLFLLLGIPAAILAALLTAILAASGRQRRRKEQALLRIRGASMKRLTRLAGIEAIFVGVVGSMLGLAGAAVAGRAAFGTSRFGASSTQSAAWAICSVVLGLAVALVTIVGPARRDARTHSAHLRGEVARVPRRPLWARAYLDIGLLAVGGLIFWEAVRNGYEVVLAPEGLPTISVSYFTLLAPLCLWVGAALFAWRVSSWTLRKGRRPVARIAKPVAGGLAGVVAASMTRQEPLLTRALVITALAATFALSTSVFNATYAAQARVDAELTNGADVTATTAANSALPAGIDAQVRAIPGVAAAEPMQHRFAYVGNDLQDLYGISPSTIGNATDMSDAFFGGGDARAVLAALGSQPSGVLVSEETVNDFRLQPGDLLRLRMQSAADHAYHVVPFHYVGVVREFPTAPRDSFIVANATYVAARTRSSAYQTLLVRTSASPPAVAARVRGLIPSSSGATVQDIQTQLTITLSGLTAIDLSGLTRLELVYAIILGAGASGLVLALGLAERRRTFAIASAVGAKTRQLASFVWSEALYVTAGGLALGFLAGWALSYVIVKILTGVFDPPPERLSWPWSYLALAIGAIILAVVVAVIATIRATRRPVIQIIRDL